MMKILKNLNNFIGPGFLESLSSTIWFSSAIAEVDKELTSSVPKFQSACQYQYNKTMWWPAEYPNNQVPLRLHSQKSVGPTNMKICSTLVIIKEMQIKTTMRQYHMPTGMVPIKKEEKNRNSQMLMRMRGNFNPFAIFTTLFTINK